MRKPLRLAAAAVVLGVVAVPAAASHAATPQDCAKQYLITSEPPPPRPVTITSTGQVTVDAEPTVDRVTGFAADTVRFTRCLATSS